ncbi:patatin-like phospholipase family protein, partial [candidate division KSB1 bacterium]|nr:patatin-like phospholipase family protein [candidate division KSB1 bacterium]
MGLALGGGAVLGAAHIGVLKAFEENDIRLAALTGTSIGAFIAALYAFGKSADEISEFVHELDWLDVTSLSLSKFGLLSNEKMGERLTEILGEVRFDQAKIPFALVATDLSSGKK